MIANDPAKRNRDTNPAEKQHSGGTPSDRQQSGGQSDQDPSHRTGVRHPERSGSLKHDPEPGRSDYFKF